MPLTIAIFAGLAATVAVLAFLKEKRAVRELLERIEKENAASRKGPPSEPARPRPDSCGWKLWEERQPEEPTQLQLPPRAHVYWREDGVPFVAANHARWAPSREALAIQLQAAPFPEAAVFSREGALLWAPPSTCDIAFCDGGTKLVELAMATESVSSNADSDGVDAPDEEDWTIRLRQWPSADLLSEWSFCAPRKKVNLSFSPDERCVWVDLFGDTTHGWRVFALRNAVVVPLPIVLKTDEGVFEKIVWSPDSDRIAGILLNHDDEMQSASMAVGPYRTQSRRIGTLVVQEIANGEIHDHEVRIPEEIAHDSWDEPDELSMRFVDPNTVEIEVDSIRISIVVAP